MRPGSHLGITLGVALGIVLGAALTALPAAAQPTLSFELAAVAARGVTPGGESIFFGVAHERPGFVGNLIRRVEVVPDDDEDGAVRLDVSTGLPPLSVWAVVDLDTGEHTVGDPRGMGLSGLAISIAAFGPPDKISVPRDEVDLLVVRSGDGPDAGSWSLYASDGGANDLDGTRNHVVVVSVPAMRPVGLGLAGPPVLAAGDVIVAFDPQSLRSGTLVVP